MMAIFQWSDNIASYFMVCPKLFQFMIKNFAIKDIIMAFRLYRYWMFCAFIKLKLSHHKTSFSFFWEAVSVFFVSTVLSIVWTRVLEVESPLDYFFYVLTGLAIWSLLISKLINKGVSSLSLRSKELQKSVRPVSILALEDITYSFLAFFSALPFVVAACVFFYGTNINFILLFVIGVVLTWLTAVGLCMTLGVLAFFVRDVLELVKAVMRLGFLVTPIIWRPSRLGEYEHLVWLNPFYSFVDICRAPLIGEWPHLNSLIIASCTSVVLLVLGFVTLAIFGNRIRVRAFSS